MRSSFHPDPHNSDRAAWVRGVVLNVKYCVPCIAFHWSNGFFAKAVARSTSCVPYDAPAAALQGILRMSQSNPNSELDPEQEYRAIERTLLQNARGRWFLSEHGRRARRVDSFALQEAIDKLQSSLRQPPAILARLRHDVEELRATLETGKRGLHEKPVDPPDVPPGTLATPNGILSAAEALHELSWSLHDDETNVETCEQIARHTSTIFALSARQAAESKRVTAFSKTLIDALEQLEGILETLGLEIVDDEFVSPVPDAAIASQTAPNLLPNEQADTNAPEASPAPPAPEPHDAAAQLNALASLPSPNVTTRAQKPAPEANPAATQPRGAAEKPDTPSSAPDAPNAPANVEQSRHAASGEMPTDDIASPPLDKKPTSPPPTQDQPYMPGRATPAGSSSSAQKAKPALPVPPATSQQDHTDTPQRVIAQPQSANAQPQSADAQMPRQRQPEATYSPTRRPTGHSEAGHSEAPKAAPEQWETQPPPSAPMDQRQTFEQHPQAPAPNTPSWAASHVKQQQAIPLGYEPASAPAAAPPAADPLADEPQQPFGRRRTPEQAPHHPAPEMATSTSAPKGAQSAPPAYMPQYDPQLANRGSSARPERTTPPTETSESGNRPSTQILRREDISYGTTTARSDRPVERTQTTGQTPPTGNPNPVQNNARPSDLRRTNQNPTADAHARERLPAREHPPARERAPAPDRLRRTPPTDGN